MTKTGPGSVVAGTEATYSMTVTNNGPTEADNVALSDPLPTGTTFVSATSSDGSCTGGGTVACLIGTLADGATATITVVVDIPPSIPPGALTNTATVSSSTPRPGPDQQHGDHDRPGNRQCRRGPLQGRPGRLRGRQRLHRRPGR